VLKLGKERKKRRRAGCGDRHVDFPYVRCMGRRDDLEEEPLLGAREGGGGTMCGGFSEETKLIRHLIYGRKREKMGWWGGCPLFVLKKIF